MAGNRRRRYKKRRPLLRGAIVVLGVVSLALAFTIGANALLKGDGKPRAGGADLVAASSGHAGKARPHARGGPRRHRHVIRKKARPTPQSTQTPHTPAP